MVWRYGEYIPFPKVGVNSLYGFYSEETGFTDGETNDGRSRRDSSSPA